MNLQNQINYLKEFFDQDMFDDCAVPSPLNMERVRGAIVMRCGLLTPLYSEPEVQRAATQQFFFENQWNFEHIVKVIEAVYSPIENVAEVREENTTNTGADTLTISRKSTESHTGIDGRTIQESGTTGTQESGTTGKQANGNTTTTNEISAENATAYQADNKSTVQHGEGETLTHGRGETLTHGKRVEDDLQHGEVITHGGSDQHVNEKDSATKFTVNRHGNIGVTTNQDMINQELDLLERFNPYKFIADLYERQLILGLY